MKLLCVIYSMSGGGAEKQLNYLMSDINREAFEVHCAFCRRDKARLHDHVVYHDISTRLRPSSLFIAFNLIRLIVRLRPDVILSFLWSMNIISLTASMITGVRTIVSERIYTPFSIASYHVAFLRKMLIRLLYQFAHVVIANSRDVKEGLVHIFQVPSSRITVIYNGIDAEAVRKKSIAYIPPVKRYICTCGSLTLKKNHELFIEAMTAFPDHTAVIVGDGPQKEHLKLIAQSKGISLILPGYVENPYPWFKYADVFVLTSHYEGFPNVLLEAMAIGTPIVSVACPGGINELIEHRITGILIKPDVDSLTKGLREIINNETLRMSVIHKARQQADSYSVLKMVKKYEDILAS